MVGDFGLGGVFGDRRGLLGGSRRYMPIAIFLGQNRVGWVAAIGTGKGAILRIGVRDPIWLVRGPIVGAVLEVLGFIWRGEGLEVQQYLSSFIILNSDGF